MTPIVGVTQDVSGGNCKNPFVLAYMESCTLSLIIVIFRSELHRCQKATSFDHKSAC